MSHTWRSEDILRYPWVSSSTLFGTRSLLFTRLAGPGASVGSISHLSRVADTHCQALCGEQTQVLTVGWSSPQLERLSFRCGLSDASNTALYIQKTSLLTALVLHSHDRKSILLSDLDANLLVLLANLKRLNTVYPPSWNFRCLEG